MSDEDWPYDEDGFPRRAGMDLDWFLQGAGFDTEDNVFTEDDLRNYFDVDFIEYDDRGRIVVPTRTLDCGCNPRAMVAGAIELSHHLSSRTLGFPRTDGQIDMLRQFHADNAPWRKWIDPTRSVPRDASGRGHVCLWGCAKPGHHCRVEVDGSGVCSVTGIDLEVLGNAAAIPGPPADTFRDTSPDQDDLEDIDDINEALGREEDNYDKRTFGDLDDDKSFDAPGHLPDPGEGWRDSGYPAQDVQIFVAQGITPSDVAELAQIMAREDVARWVRRFKEDWKAALDLYRPAIGMADPVEEVAPIVEALAESIRMAVHSALRKTRRRPPTTDTREDTA